MNIALATQCLKQLARWGVEEIILCAGARNAPLVYVLEKAKGFRITPFFEERSAAFFALGLSQNSKRPVAIVTTSGTAVAELLPAAIEATYTETPLIFITADRPRSYRGTGAPQAIEQVGIFHKYIETCLDVESVDDKFEYEFWTRRSPLQINICFKEPLIDSEIVEIDFQKIREESDFLHKIPALKPQRKWGLNEPLIIAGPMSSAEADCLVPFLVKWGAPIYAETLSHLREIKEIQHLLLKSGDQIVRQAFVKGYAKSVLRLGGVPTLRFWRDLEEVFSGVNVVALSRTEMTGLSRPSKLVIGFENCDKISVEWIQDFRQEIFQMDSRRVQAWNQIKQTQSWSEISILEKVSSLSKNSFVYIGNSLPIREWDLVDNFVNQEILPPPELKESEGHHPPTFRYAGNRGANGIDGQVASFLGHAKVSSLNECWGVFGDLTTLYDLAALALKSQLKGKKIRIVVVNNSGGMIFKEMFQEKNLFLNTHEIEFEKWAEMFQFGYMKWNSIEDYQRSMVNRGQWPDHLVIELVPDSLQSQEIWKQYRALP